MNASGVAALHQQIERLQADLAVSQEELEKHRAARWLCSESEQMQRQAKNEVLAQLSELRQERDELKAVVRRIQTEVSHSDPDTLQAIFAEKDSQINHLSQALTRTKADMSIVAQGLERKKA